MSTPHAKRRRMNDATKTLHKPFKSPFRTPLKRDPALTPPSSDPPDVARTDGTFSTSSDLSLSSHPTAAKPLLPRSNFHTPSRTIQQKSNPRLTREIMQIRSDIQILEQAHALLTTTKDADLELLVDRWRSASRAAAEEVFAGTRDRVNRMGGVGAWKQREKEQKEWRQKWDKEEAEAQKGGDEDEDGDGENGKENMEQYVYDDYGNLDKKEDAHGVDDSAGAEDDSFTMDMMLRTLNIDLKLIGYDREAQLWD
ncbi:hypothetical protein EJ04DRAFT_511003 [Polyplosphaeria fusca]|uniref:Uncharacterized protein n=1 Tax=Polyplosphaeria fusca TaxID=682080 RepID=A0A9P4QZJ8_9PLEO|nr:hypothetical protein EJ04DRAFT_511003 [Polyplosphaeria fusca]